MSDEENFSIAEWTITNISFRERYILHLELKTDEGFFKRMRAWLCLHPRVDKGRMMVRLFFTGRRRPDISGDLSFLCPDGSLIGPPQELRRQDPPREECFDVVGPRFEGVVERLRNFPEEPLTVRLRIRSEVGSVHVWRHELDVHRSSLKVSLMSPGAFEENYPMEIPLAGGKVNTRITIKGVGGNFEFALWRPNNCNRFEAQTRLSVLAADGSVTRTERNEREWIPPYGSEKWIFSKSLATTTTEEETTVLLDLAFSGGHTVSTSNHSQIEKGKFSISPAILKPSAGEETPVHVLANDFRNLFLDGDLADFEIGCEGVTFPVHPNVLSARSPVFKAMLANSDFRESKSGRLDVTDLDAPTLSRFLAFLYSGAFVEEDLDCDTAVQLHIAADKYQVPSLKKQCASFLGANVCASNACEILCLAERHRDEELFAHVCKFISENFKEIRETEEWKSLIEKDPLLVNKTLTRFD